MRVGDIAERHMIDNDVVRITYIAKYLIHIYIHTYIHTFTYAVLECVCTPYNADFDGAKPRKPKLRYAIT